MFFYSKRRATMRLRIFTDKYFRLKSRRPRLRRTIGIALMLLLRWGTASSFAHPSRTCSTIMRSKKGTHPSPRRYSWAPAKVDRARTKPLESLLSLSRYTARLCSTTTMTSRPTSIWLVCIFKGRSLTKLSNTSRTAWTRMSRKGTQRSELYSPDNLPRRTSTLGSYMTIREMSQMQLRITTNPTLNS